MALRLGSNSGALPSLGSASSGHLRLHGTGRAVRLPCSGPSRPGARLPCRRLSAQRIACSSGPSGPGGPASRPQEVAQLAAIPTRVKAPIGAEDAEAAAAAAVEAAKGLDAKLGELRKEARRLYDRVYYGDVLPPVGSFQLSYARLLELLKDRKVKRIVLLADGRAAIVEIPVENTESDWQTLTYDRRDLSIAYAEEVPEYQMEKNRYYVELPGDVWEEGTFMELIKDAQEKRVLMNGELRVPYDSMLRVNQVRPELQVVDPSDAYVWLNEYSSQFVPIIGLLLLRVVVGIGQFFLQKSGKQKKSEQEQLAEELGKHRAREYNVEEGGKAGGKKEGTGVRYDDVAGIDHIKADIKEVLDILLGDERYLEMGAHPVRGVLLEGPPGTGKTLLAKAMAGEAGIPFYSANGAEFVEMFQGVAAARIRSLFRAARRNAPAIIFIDEIDAIGKKRSDGPTDSGTQEREQGLMQMLTEMDGFYQDDKVLVVAATNRADALDDALLRPGRFDRKIHMGLPSTSNRLKILQVHARNKPVRDPELLARVAELAIGYSGAELANLMNEAAILAVRKDEPEIDMATLTEAMDKTRLGLPHQALPESAAKRQYAAVEAARAVAFALTPGLPRIEHVTIQPRGGHMAQILFVPQEFGKDGGMWHQLGTPCGAANAVHLDRELTQLEMARGLLTPLYAARACEEVLFGREAASLSTSAEVSRAGELARWIVMDSRLHPATRDERVTTNRRPGGRHDPTVKWLNGAYDGLILDLQRRAYADALRLVAQRATVIRQVATELCENRGELVTGERIVELLRTTPLDEVDEAALAAAAGQPPPPPEAAAAAASSSGAGARAPAGAGPAGDGAEAAGAGAATAVAERAATGGAASTSGRAAVEAALGPEITSDEALVSLAEVVMGRVSEWDLLPGGQAASKAQHVRQQLLDPAQRARLEAVAAYVRSTPGDGTPPPPPPVQQQQQQQQQQRQRQGAELEDFRPPEENLIDLTPPA